MSANHSDCRNANRLSVPDTLPILFCRDGASLETAHRPSRAIDSICWNHCRYGIGARRSFCLLDRITQWRHVSLERMRSQPYARSRSRANGDAALVFTRWHRTARCIVATKLYMVWNGGKKSSRDTQRPVAHRCLTQPYSLHSSNPSPFCTPPTFYFIFIFICFIRGVPNSGFRLFGRIRIRIRIALAAEHFDAAPAVLIFTISLCPSLITAVPACCLRWPSPLHSSNHLPKSGGLSESSWHWLSKVGRRCL